MNIYQDITERTNGDIYIGVVGPVRSGKSTFVSNFMQKLILPKIADKNEQKRAMDELPQSADGKTIMTTQPKFVPNVAVNLCFADKSTANVRLIDCVGYLIEGAEGHLEGDKTRLVNTPWSNEPLPFEKAAEIGTQKVATEHSSVAVVVTTDGSIGEIMRQSYVSAEERAVKELKLAGKPFVVVLNSAHPSDSATVELAKALEEKYNVCVLPLDVLKATAEQLEQVLQSILQEFSVRCVSINLPKWMRALDKDNKIIANIVEVLKSGTAQLDKMKDAEKLIDCYQNCDYLQDAKVDSLEMGNGTVTYTLVPKENLYFECLGEQAQTDISDEYSLMRFVCEASFAKAQYERIKDALGQADATGYGVVYPQLNNIKLDEPQMVKQGSIYGVKMGATAPSYHIVKVDVDTQVSPMIGTQQQSEYLLAEYKKDPQTIWNTNMFGKTMADLAREGLMGKCSSVPVDVKQKISKTLSKIVNENRGGLICFLL